ncbi:AsmA family protein [Paraferrimonas sp. SM1919]|uniref:AsmA family protein n=1 Tax=Paraferrimonas sp. SM1919 TaxID=2662263 RepID=UPI0013CFFBDD|nr:AsmA family protein [Paraferrimonas sp. SM1919]
MKKIILLLLAAVAIGIAAALALVAAVDPNDYKQQLSEQAEQNSGYQLDMPGNIDWQLFPSIGLNLGETIIYAPETKSQPVAQLESVELELSLAALLQGQLEVDLIRVNRPQVNLIKLKDGSSNFIEEQGVNVTEADVNVEVEVETEQSPNSLNLDIALLELNDASFSYIDETKGVSQQISGVHFSLAKQGMSQWHQFTFRSNIVVDELTAQVEASGLMLPDPKSFALSDVKGSLQAQSAELDLKRFELALASFNFNEVGTLNIQSELVSGENEVALNGEIPFSIDKAFSSFKAQNSVLDIKLTNPSLANPKTPFSLKFDADYLINDGKFSADAQFESPKAIYSKLEVEADLAQQNYQFNVDSNLLDLDALLLQKEEPAIETKGKEDDQQPLDLSSLESFTINASLNLANIKAQGWMIDSLSGKAQLYKGMLSMPRFIAKLYDGNVSFDAQLALATPNAGHKANLTIESLNLAPISYQLAAQEVVKSSLNSQLKLTTKGLDKDSLLNSLNGDGQLKLTKGSIEGGKVGEQLLSAYQSLAKPKQLPANRLNFDNMSASVKFVDGKAVVSQTRMTGNEVDATADGWYQLVSGEFDMNIAATEKHNNSTLPVRLYGTTDDIQYELKLEQYLQDRAKQEIENRLKDRLKGLFGG